MLTVKAKVLGIYSKKIPKVNKYSECKDIQGNIVYSRKLTEIN